jgi:hypothetical protein
VLSLASVSFPTIRSVECCTNSVIDARLPLLHTDVDFDPMVTPLGLRLA